MSTTQETILFIEDDDAGREMGMFNLEKAGYRVVSAATGEAGLSCFDPALHDLVITDLRMPGLSGMDVLERVKADSPETPVLVITAYADVAQAVQAMKRGAFDFIGKPFQRDHLILVVQKALERRRMNQEILHLRVKAGGVERPIVHGSDAMQRVLDITDRTAPSDATLLITGESGTGKELIARRVHVRSARAEGPFVAVNAAAMPSELLASELFGHEKGAYTGADKARQGRFRSAEGGTLFLDEIGDLPLPLQAKLLRVLQERVVDIVGSDAPIPVDVRVIAATNKDLKAEVAAGRFRDDLFYRINVIAIDVPPLRARPDDIPLLTHHFVDTFSGGLDLDLPAPLMETLRAHPWPGNVRELENICQRLVLLSNGETLSAGDLPPGFGAAESIEDAAHPLGADWPPLPEAGLSLVDLERRVIERVLAMKAGNVTQAAAYLNVPRHVLAYRMEKYGIPRK